MRIVVEDLPNRPVHFSGAGVLALPRGQDPDGLVVQEPVIYRIEVLRQDSSVRVEGCVEAVVDAVCSRCAQQFPMPLDRQFSVVFIAANEYEGVLETELDENDLDLDYYDGVSIDGLQLFGEQVMLELPMRTLCADECRGLCVTCGADLNHGECDCESDVSLVWAPLRTLRAQH